MHEGDDDDDDDDADENFKGNFSIKITQIKFFVHEIFFFMLHSRMKNWIFLINFYKISCHMHQRVKIDCTHWGAQLSD